MIHPAKVLLVDDEPHVRKFLSLVVRGLGQPAIIEASNGEEAVYAYMRERPDLVLLDVNMPGMDGVDTLRALLAADPDATVVMVTSLTNRQTIEQAVEAGAAGYIRKDTPKEEILAILASCLPDDENDDASPDHA